MAKAGKQAGTAQKARSRKLTARVTHLEMTGRPVRHIPQPTRPRIALLLSEHMPVHFYRYLYEQIGKPYHWYNRRIMNDEALESVIHAPETFIEVLYADGNPAGFFELDMSGLPQSVELAYFGLVPEYQGMGLGKWLLLTAIHRAWEKDPERLTVHTNTLDHPSALRIYQQMGFEPVGISEETVTAWE